MKKLPLILSLLLLPTLAYAQQAPAEINLKLSVPEVETLWKAVRKLPVEEVEALMAKVRQQVAEQTAPKPVEPAKKE